MKTTHSKLFLLGLVFSIVCASCSKSDDSSPTLKLKPTLTTKDIYTCGYEFNGKSMLPKFGKMVQLQI